MGARSAFLAFRVQTELWAYVRNHFLGIVLPSETPVQIWPERPSDYRKPDGLFIASGRLPHDQVPAGMINVPPDLVIESMSPTDRGESIETKVQEYLDAGVRLVWVIYPGTRSVHVYRPDGTAARVTSSGALSGEDVIPGFTLKLEELFGPQ